MTSLTDVATEPDARACIACSIRTWQSNGVHIANGLHAASPARGRRCAWTHGTSCHAGFLSRRTSPFAESSSGTPPPRIGLY